MHVPFNKRLALVWLVLCTLTIAYLGIDDSTDRHGLPTASALVTVTAISIAAVKLRIIFREFMDVRHAPPRLCRLTDGWVLLIAGCLLTSYFVGASIG